MKIKTLQKQLIDLIHQYYLRKEILSLLDCMNPLEHVNDLIYRQPFPLYIKDERFIQKYS